MYICKGTNVFGVGFILQILLLSGRHFNFYVFKISPKFLTWSPSLSIPSSDIFLTLQAKLRSDNDIDGTI